MTEYNKTEIEEALRALNSLLSKSEKCLPKLKEGTSQHTLLINRIKALKLAVKVLEEKVK